jgi:hypothetical protein
MERGPQEATAAAAAAAAMNVAHSYRVTFRRREFLALVEIAKPTIISHRGRIHFFANDGFVMYTFECNDSEFRQKVVNAIEFSNRP